MQAWKRFLQQQETELGKATIDKWLKPLKLTHFDACNIFLEASDSFQALWFEEHIRFKAESQLLDSKQKPIKIHLSVANTPPTPKSRSKKKGGGTAAPFSLQFDSLDPSCSLDNFFLTEENLLTYRFLRELLSSSFKLNTASHGMEFFNPIYIYGGRGSGKTHLLMSMAQIFQSQGLKTIYVRAETFTDHVVSAIRSGEMSLFRKSYRNIDLLLVDDVHIFSRKGATQEEFFHTFNTLHLEGKQIILSANCPPQQLQLIESRLVSRFEWGIALPLKMVKPEEMEQLLQMKAKALNFPLTEVISKFLIENFTSNPKKLVQALEALILRLHLDPNHSLNAVTAAGVRTLLGDLLIEEQKLAINADKIIHAVAEQYGIRIEDLLGKSQTREYSLPRKLAMHLCREELKLPFMQIGTLFGRDHSTVMSGIKYIQQGLVDKNVTLSDDLNAIIKKLHN